MNTEMPGDGLTLILGGARSGKSSFAEQVARDAGNSVLYIATAEAKDGEMSARISKHRAARPKEWQTLELTNYIGRSLIGQVPPLVIVDCITMLVSNILMSFPEGAADEDILQKIQAEIEELIAAQERLGGRWLVVSNEVGLGLVPPYPLGRIYRDALGFANQALARAASRVILMVAGIPVGIK